MRRTNRVGAVTRLAFLVSGSFLTPEALSDRKLSSISNSIHSNEPFNKLGRQNPWALRRAHALGTVEPTHFAWKGGETAMMRPASLFVPSNDRSPFFNELPFHIVTPMNSASPVWLVRLTTNGPRDSARIDQPGREPLAGAQPTAGGNPLRVICRDTKTVRIVFSHDCQVR